MLTSQGSEVGILFSGRTMDNLRSLIGMIEAHTGSDGVFTTSMPRVFLIRASEPTQWVHTLYEPSICFVAQGGKRVECGNHKLTYISGFALAVASATPVKGRVIEASRERPFLCARIEPDIDLMQGSSLSHRYSISKRAEKGLATFRPSVELEDAIFRLIRLLDTPRDINVLGPLVEIEILYHIGRAMPAFRQLAISNSITGRTAQAANYLRRHFRKEMSLRRLADHASMTTRSFRANFSRLTGYTPENYKRMLRLQEARRLIYLGVPPEAAARSSGYTDQCEFGADYATAFEAMPRIEAVRLRTTSAVDLEE